MPLGYSPPYNINYLSMFFKTGNIPFRTGNIPFRTGMSF